MALLKEYLKCLSVPPGHLSDGQKSVSLVPKVNGKHSLPIKLLADIQEQSIPIHLACQQAVDLQTFLTDVFVVLRWAIFKKVSRPREAVKGKEGEGRRVRKGG